MMMKYTDFSSTASAAAARTDPVVAEPVDGGASLEVEGEHLARGARLGGARPVAAPALRHVQPASRARHLRRRLPFYLK